MSSNTSKGRGRKGSKFWIQTLVNLDYGSTLSKAIKSVDSGFGRVFFGSHQEKFAILGLRAMNHFIIYLRSPDGAH
jgi:hypothetical protein